jgi:hypothetical protein
MGYRVWGMGYSRKNKTLNPVPHTPNPKPKP